MKKISFVVGKDYLNNRVFDLNNSILNRDECLLPFYLLKEKFKKLNYEIATQDIISPQEADIVLYNEMPKINLNLVELSKSYLIIFESELIRSDNWDLTKHQLFKKIFTWNDQFVDGKKYLKFNFPNKLQICEVESCKREKLITLISGNKTCNHPLELYSKRLEAIKWFEKEHPDDFDYYGVGWDYSFSLWWQKVFRKLKILKFIPQNKSQCYRGKVKIKSEVLRNYQFSICYENGRDISGYITEKIIDCFVAGNIPVYWGPQNITNHIPANTFIDKNKFNSYEELYDHLKNMNLEEVLLYQENIKKFLQSEAGYRFSNEFFVDTITAGVLSE